MSLTDVSRTDVSRTDVWRANVWRADVWRSSLMLPPLRARPTPWASSLDAAPQSTERRGVCCARCGVGCVRCEVRCVRADGGGRSSSLVSESLPASAHRCRLPTP